MTTCNKKYSFPLYNQLKMIKRIKKNHERVQLKNHKEEDPSHPNKICYILIRQSTKIYMKKTMTIHLSPLALPLI